MAIVAGWVLVGWTVGSPPRKKSQLPSTGTVLVTSIAFTPVPAPAVRVARAAMICPATIDASVMVGKLTYALATAVFPVSLAVVVACGVAKNPPEDTSSNGPGVKSITPAMKSPVVKL